jgi:hypothetical protein
MNATLGGLTFVDLEGAHVAGIVAVTFAQLYIAEALKTISQDTLLRAVEAQIVTLGGKDDD